VVPPILGVISAESCPLTKNVLIYFLFFLSIFRIIFSRSLFPENVFELGNVCVSTSVDTSRQLQVGGANKAVLGTHIDISGPLGAHTQGPGIYSLDTFFQARKQAAYVLRYAKMFRKYGATPRRGVFYKMI
jgi:hypothetical protein